MEGTTVFQDGQRLRHFGTNPETVLGTTKQTWAFDCEARGEAVFDGRTYYPARLRLTSGLAPLAEFASIDELS